MASVCRIFQTELRLMGSLSAVRARLVRSARDCRLSGSPVWQTASQAIALTVASSRGGKDGLAAAPRPVGHREVTSGPALTPALDLAAGQTNAPAGFLVSQVGMLMQEQGQLEALDRLVRQCLAPDLLPGKFHEVLREGRPEQRGGAGHTGTPFPGEILQKPRGRTLYAIAGNLDIN